MVDIPDVVMKLVLPREGISSVNLCPACDAGFDLVATRLLLRIES